MSRPRPLLPAWPRLARRLRVARRRILMCDFDGTLAPIRRYYRQARLPKATRRLLARIAAGGAIVGVVSGRGLADLEKRVRLAGIWYVGSHGYEWRDPRGRVRVFATPAERRRIRRAGRWIAPRIAGLAGVLLDAKPASLALHYRAATPAAARAAVPIVRELVRRHRGLRLLPGRKVWEVLPQGSGNKWAAVRRVLRCETGNPSGQDFVVYLGDDTADESVFKNMQGISVIVGRPARSSARYSLRSPAELRKFLERWLQTLD